MIYIKFRRTCMKHKLPLSIVC